MEYNFVCVDNRKCLYILDPVNQLCGNGILEQILGEDCDDGNKLNGDGCSNLCKVESGWDCRIYDWSIKRSFCSKRSYGYCGNGVVDWG